MMPDSANKFMVSVNGKGEIRILLAPLAPMPLHEALNLAAWLVALADPGSKDRPDPSFPADHYPTPRLYIKHKTLGEMKFHWGGREWGCPRIFSRASHRISTPGERPRGVPLGGGGRG